MNNLYGAGYNQDALTRSVIVVFDRFKSDGKEPGAEHWTMYGSSLAGEMAANVRDQYHKETGSVCDFTGEDIAKAWMAWRKHTKARRQEVRKEVGMP